MKIHLDAARSAQSHAQQDEQGGEGLLPPMQPTHFIHLPNRKRQQPTKRARDTRGTEEHRLSQLHLIPLIPQRQIIRHARE